MSTATIHDNMTTIGPDDPEWDTISTFTGKPLTQEQKEANDARRRQNKHMLDSMNGGERLYQIVRHFPYGGTQESPKHHPRTFLVRSTGGAQAKRIVQDEIDAAIDGLAKKER